MRGEDNRSRGAPTRPPARSVGGATSDVHPLARLFEIDPDLLRHVPLEQAAHLRQSVSVRTETLEPGPWRPSATLADERHLGVLVLDGFLTRDVTVFGNRSVELIGAGDVIRPGQGGDESASVPYDVGWTVLTLTKLGLLDARFQLRAAQWPGVTNELLGRAIERSQSAGLHRALTATRRIPVHMRLHVLLWRLADRWGRRTGGLVVVPVPLSHRVLAQLVSAQRESTTRALGRLARDRLVSRRDDGAWLLHGDPPPPGRYRLSRAA